MVSGKMTLSTLQTVKALQAMTLVNFQVPSEHELTDSIRAALAAHRMKVFGVRGHQYGLADVCVWQAATTHVLKQIKADPPQLTVEQHQFLVKLDEHRAPHRRGWAPM